MKLSLNLKLILMKSFGNSLDKLDLLTIRIMSVSIMIYGSRCTFQRIELGAPVDMNWLSNTSV